MTVQDTSATMMIDERTESQAVAALVQRGSEMGSITVNDAREVATTIARSELESMAARHLYTRASGMLRREAQERETEATKPETTTRAPRASEVQTRTVLAVLGQGETLPEEVLNERAPAWRGTGIALGTLWRDLTREQVNRIYEQYHAMLGGIQAGLARAALAQSCYERVPQAQTLGEACATLSN